MLAAIREITGSVWLCVLCHAIINSAGNFFHYDMYGSYLASSITTASLIIISIIIVLIYHRFYLAHERHNMDRYNCPKTDK